MKSILNYALTKREQALLILLLAVLVLGGWYMGIYAPISARIKAADTTELEEEMALEQLKAARIKSMQKEIDANKEAEAPVVASYNNFKQELDELTRVYGQAYDFKFSFSEPQQKGNTVCRNISISCTAEDYDTALAMSREILNGPYRSLISNMKISSSSQVNADLEPDIREGRVSLTFDITYFETTVGADSLEGLPVKSEKKASSGGLANADMSNLQRSDLETAAEAAFGE